MNSSRAKSPKLSEAIKLHIHIGKNHWEAVKWILKYLKATADVGLVYGIDQRKHVDVDGFVDADYAKDPDNGRSITGHLVLKKERATREKRTTIPARYTNDDNVSLSRPSRSKETNNLSEKDEWVRAMEEEMSSLKKNHTWELVDQPPGQKLHINVRYHFIREIVESKEIEVAKIGTKDNAVDAFRKVVPERWKRRGLLVEEMIKIFKDLDIEYRMLPVDINVRKMPTSASNRLPSNWKACTN
nr:retrovirus-related Pol polyprotein from transposon TNT 1-94 [Tanacetum cinerariifolium]